MFISRLRNVDWAKIDIGSGIMGRNYGQVNLVGIYRMDLEGGQLVG